VPVVAIVIIVGSLVAGNGLYFALMHRRGIRFFRLVPDAPPYVFERSPSVALRGGSRIGMWRAGAPLSKLTVDDARARISGFNPTVDIEREMVTNVHSVSPCGSKSPTRPRSRRRSARPPLYRTRWRLHPIET
jgi:hypothetical protein